MLLQKLDSFVPNSTHQANNEKLNKPFSVAEIAKSTRGINNNNASGIDCVINELFKNSPDSVLILITDYILI